MGGAADVIRADYPAVFCLWLIDNVFLLSQRNLWCMQCLNKTWNNALLMEARKLPCEKFILGSLWSGSNKRWEETIRSLSLYSLRKLVFEYRKYYTLPIDFLSSLTNLTHLDLGQNAMRERDSQRLLARALESMTELKYLDTSQKGITSEFKYTKISNAVFTWRLNVINVSNNNMNSDMSKYTINLLECYNLTTLNLSGNNLSMAISHVLQALTIMTSLVQLHVANANIGKSNTWEDWYQIAACRRLKVLDVSKNGFSEDVLYALTPPLLQLTSLTYLDLSLNSFSACRDVQTSLISLREGLTSLTYLDVSCPMLDREFTAAMITFLHVDHNRWP